jgi:peptidoglycan/LPS O-acetylase OafA/YrhL
MNQKSVHSLITALETGAPGANVSEPVCRDANGGMETKGDKSNSSTGLGHIPGFDYLRVYFMLMVLLAHTNFFSTFGDQRQATIGPGPNLWDIVYFQLQASAVPAFVLMSLLLFSVKIPTWERSWDRVKKLTYLYVFWVGSWVLYSKCRPEPGFYGLFEFLIRGGGWVLYTFVVLMILTPLSVVAYRMSQKSSWLGLTISMLVVIATFAYLHDGFKWVRNYYYWVPTCFVMMPFAAVMLVPRLKELKSSAALRWKWVLGLLLISAMCALVEWHFSAPKELIVQSLKRVWLPKHARPSVQFGAMALIIASLGVKSQVNVIVQFFSRNSLGVYCLHPFVLRGIAAPVQRIVDPIAPGLSILASCLAVAVVCSLISEFLRLAFKQRLI